jgi:hypothetical protein
MDAWGRGRDCKGERATALPNRKSLDELDRFCVESPRRSRVLRGFVRHDCGETALASRFQAEYQRWGSTAKCTQDHFMLVELRLPGFSAWLPQLPQVERRRSLGLSAAFVPGNGPPRRVTLPFSRRRDQHLAAKPDPPGESTLACFY